MMMRSTKTKNESAEKVLSRGFQLGNGGAMVRFDAPPEARGTTSQVCGMDPFATGTGSPLIGVPLGKELTTGEPVCCDPMSWFRPGGLITNPSAFFLSNPGLGKSTMIRRMLTGLAGFGINSMVLGDTKDEYVPLIRQLSGPEGVNELGRGVGYINPLDDLDAHKAYSHLNQARADELRADVHSRRFNLMSSLMAVSRGRPVTELDENLLDAALTVLEERFGERDIQPLPQDLLDVIKARPDRLRDAALDRGDDDRYDEITEPFERSVTAIAGRGAFGQMFARQSTSNVSVERSIVYGISRIQQADTKLRAATLMACWAHGFGAVTVHNTEIDQIQADETAAGVPEKEQTKRRSTHLVLDELWNTLSAGPGIVDNVNALTRLNRAWGVGQTAASHTMSDLNAMSSEEDRSKAKGFVNRSSIKILGGLPLDEMPLLTPVVPLSKVEQKQLSEWQDPTTWSKGNLPQAVYSYDDMFDTDEAEDDEPTGEFVPTEEDWVNAVENKAPGRGLFLIKVGSRPGIAFRNELTPTEVATDIHNTETMWQDKRNDDTEEHRRRRLARRKDAEVGS
jgi:hypothetical protein